MQTLLSTFVNESGDPYPKMQTAAPCVLCQMAQSSRYVLA